MSATDSTQKQQALARLRRAAEFAGADPAQWTRYVSALLDAGQKGRARKVAKSAPLAGAARNALVAMAENAPGAASGPPLADLVSLVRTGRTSDARRLGGELLKRFPADAKLLNVLGVMALSADDPLDAEAYLRRALVADPASDDARANLGLAIVRQGRGGAAVEILQPLAQRSNAPIAARVNLVSAFLRADRPRDALDLSVEILKDTPGDPETMALRAQAHLALGQGAAALETLAPLRDDATFDLHDLVADAIERTEGRATAMLYVDGLGDLPRATARRLAALLAEWGELDSAARLSRPLAETDPSDPSPFRLIGLCEKWNTEDPLIDAMKRGLNNDALSPAQRGSFGLSLAKSHIDARRDEAAFDALLAGNEQLRKTVRYDVETDLGRFQAIADTWNSEAFASAQDGQGPDIAPIFIVGLPRSGSTLIETVLSRHPSVTPLGETPYVHSAVRDAGNKPDHRAIRAIRDAATEFLIPPTRGGVTTDKLLSNFTYLGALAAAFPNARFIEAKRDLRAVCLSIFQAELTPVGHPYAMNLEELARYAVGYSRLMNHWEEVLGSRLYRASYELLVSDPVMRIPELVGGAGLAWNGACLGTTPPERRINTFSVAQARQPITTASVARWTRYEKGLQPLIDILEDEGVLASQTT